MAIPISRSRSPISSSRIDVSKRPIYGEVESAPGERTVDPALEQLSNWMDSVFQIPGLRWRFGLDAILGLIPGLGDTLTSAVSLYLLTAATRHGVSKVTIARMGLNLCIDYAIGSIPFVGDAFDVWFKANNRNMALLKRSLSTTGVQQRGATHSDWLFVGGVIACVILVLIAALVGAVYMVGFLFDSLAQLF